MGEFVFIFELQGIIEASFITNGSDNLATGDAASGRPGEMAGIHLNMIGQIQKAGNGYIK